MFPASVSHIQNTTSSADFLGGSGRIHYARGVAAPDFEQLVEDFYMPLYRFALSLSRNEADAADLVQQTYFLWASKGHQLRDASKVKTWLFTTLHRMFLEGRRKQTRFPHSGLDEVAPEDLPASSSSLDDHMDSAEVLKALAQVPEVYQGAVALFHLEDCSYREIAEILEVAEGTVKSRIARGITQLRRLMGAVPPLVTFKPRILGIEKKPTLGAQPPHSE